MISDWDKLEYIYQVIVRMEAERLNSLEVMTKHMTTRVIRELVTLADGEDYSGCLQVWEDHCQSDQMWLNGKMDSINRKKVKLALDQAVIDRGDYDDYEPTEKDQLREAARAAKG